MDERKLTQQEDESLTQIIADEVLRSRVRSFVGEPKKSSWFQSVVSSQLFLLFLGFILSGMVGSYLTNRYSSRQAELQHARSFADEINKTRVSKIGEVWEKVDTYEAGARSIMEEIHVYNAGAPADSGTQMAIFAESQKAVQEKYEGNVRAHQELSALLDKNRFWLGDDLYEEIKKYVETTYDYYLAVKRKEPVTELDEKRRNARTGLNQIRDKMLKGDV